MPYAGDAAVYIESGPKPTQRKGNATTPVQNKSGPHTGKSLGLSRFSKKDLDKKDDQLIPIEEAAEYCGLDVKRLRGRIFRNSVRLGDPIGSLELGLVYRWSLPKRTPDATSATP